LLAAGGLDRFDEILVVPGVDLARTGMNGASGNCSSAQARSGRSGPLSKLVVRMVGRLKNLAMSPGQHVVLELVGEILHQRDQAGLVVDQQHNRITSLFRRLYGTLLIRNSLVDGYCR
jgi:hypothetical protein